MITRTERNQTFDTDGNLIAEKVVEVDVTEEVNRPIVDAAIDTALAQLQTLVDYPAVGAVPAGTMTTAQLSNVVRAMRDAIQENRSGAQIIAKTLRQTIRLVRGDFDGID